MGEIIEKASGAIQEVDIRSMNKAQERLDNLTKPPGSLGVLEEIVVKLSGIYREPPKSLKKAILVMAADHGIVDEGVSAFPQEVTVQMLQNFKNGGAAINVLARCSGADIVVADIGVKGNSFKDDFSNRFKIREGTDNFCKKPAMTFEEAVRSVEAGIEIVENEISKGANIIAIGEMGIGNTTPSAAVLSAVAELDPGKAVGKGTGIDEEKLNNKRDLIRNAVNLHTPDPNNPLDVLAKIGGFEIGSLMGVILGAAGKNIPVVIDGFISGAAAMLAVKQNPLCRDYIIASHLSSEPGHKLMLDWLGLKPMIVLDMRLGEGTGAALAFQLIESSVRVYNEMATFEEAGVSQ